MPIKTSEKLVGLLPVGAIPESLVVSADSRHFTCVAIESGNKMRVAYDGELGPLYDGIQRDTPILSPDGKHYAYVAQQQGKEAVVLDGVEGPEFIRVVEERLCFSPDSQRVAYVGYRDGKMIPVIDGVEGDPYDWVFRGPSFFSPDSQRVCFIGKRDEKMSVVVDGVEGEPVDAVRAGTPVFSPDSSKVAYIALSGGTFKSHSGPTQGMATNKGGQVAVFYDGVRHAAYDEIPNEIRFSSNGNRIGYVGIRAGQAYVNVDGVELGPYDAADEAAPFFSPDGSRVAYNFHSSKGSVVVVDGVQSEAYSAVGAGTPLFSPDGQHIASVVKRGGKSALVLDGKEREVKYHFIQKHALAFSPDSQRVAFGARTGLFGLKGCVEVDGKAGSVYLSLGLSAPVFSPDSKRVAYMAGPKLNKAFAVVDGVEGQECNKFADGSLRFSPDGRFVVYLAEIKGQPVIMVDGISGEKGVAVTPSQGNAIRGSEIVFDSDNSFHILTLSPNREIKILEVSVEA